MNINRIRGLLRLGTLCAVILAALSLFALPATAATVKTCRSDQQLPEVEVLQVSPIDARVVWDATRLARFDRGAAIPSGMLAVQFNDLQTGFKFDGYIIEAVPGDSPGHSAKLGVKTHVSDIIQRPSSVGATMSTTLHLEPGTQYYVTVQAVNHNIVRISPRQRAQDQMGGTTLLRAPFPGSAVWLAVNARTGLTDATPQADWAHAKLDDGYSGPHYLRFDKSSDDAQFHWLDADTFGPFDHTVITDGDKTYMADLASIDKDGDMGTCLDDDNATPGFNRPTCGPTHYQFEALDANGNPIARERVDVEDGRVTDEPLYMVSFPADPGDLTITLTLGRTINGRYRALSDTAIVRVTVPGDTSALSQTAGEFNTLMSGTGSDAGLVGGGTGDDIPYTSNDDARRFYDSLWSKGQDPLSSDEPATTEAAALRIHHQTRLAAHLNNQFE